MTFTEAALEVLRLVGKPLHYKKITEVAIERNLLSHVGKTPEVTMSSRLATMVKKDRGDAPIIKVKPGVFGLREFSDEILKAAEHESGHDYELPPETEAPEAAGSAPAEKAGNGQGGQPVDASAKGDAGGDAEVGTKKDDEDAGESKKAASTRRLPGQEVFPEEDDDDEPIFGKPSDGDEDDDD
ncbi:MAG TPA: winged helix-turn-helix domain-containing protein, partial [Polyangiaceae bacterium LLY-WYZ-14_1]|nr:winged helix-turn-helix domain-containing protein [Polyangiaceae bacterium LLY-WYZ-14_1]